MISVKLADIINSTETLQKLAQKDFNAKAAWTIARILKNADTEVQSFNEARMNLIKKYGVKNENGELHIDEAGNYRITPESVEEFNKELNDLLDSTVEINANKLPLDLLASVNFTPIEMAQLEPFIEIEE